MAVDGIICNVFWNLWIIYKFKFPEKERLRLGQVFEKIPISKWIFWLDGSVERVHLNLTCGMKGDIIMKMNSEFKCVWPERVAWMDAAESCRLVRGNCWGSGEVHSVSSVLNRTVGTTGATVISLRLFTQRRCPSRAAKSMRPIPWGTGEAEW